MTSKPGVFAGRHRPRSGHLILAMGDGKRVAPPSTGSSGATPSKPAGFPTPGPPRAPPRSAVSNKDLVELRPHPRNVLDSPFWCDRLGFDPAERDRGDA